VYIGGEATANGREGREGKGQFYVRQNYTQSASMVQSTRFIDFYLAVTHQLLTSEVGQTTMMRRAVGDPFQRPWRRTVYMSAIDWRVFPRPMSSGNEEGMRKCVEVSRDG
jgi:hypothetical protein